MPRPKVLKEGKVVPIVFDIPLLEATRMVARRKGISVSQLVREAVVMYLRDQAVALGIQTVFDDNSMHNSNPQVGPAASGTDPAPDPIILFRRKQFERQLEVFERSFQRVVDEWERLKPRIAGGYNTRVLDSSFFRLRDRVRDLEKWLHRILRDYKNDVRDQALDSRVRDLVVRVIDISGELQRMLG